MGYINEIRKIISKRPFISVVVLLLFVNEKDQLLMMKRKDNKCWGVPGGALELGENLSDAIKRETKEETGLEIGAMVLFGIYSGPEFYYKYPSGEETYNVFVAYLSQNLKGTIKINSEEHTDYCYFNINDLPPKISPPIIPIIKDLVTKHSENRE